MTARHSLHRFRLRRLRLCPLWSHVPKRPRLLPIPVGFRGLKLFGGIPRGTRADQILTSPRLIPQDRHRPQRDPFARGMESLEAERTHPGIPAVVRPWRDIWIGPRRRPRPVRPQLSLPPIPRGLRAPLIAVAA